MVVLGSLRTSRNTKQHNDISVNQIAINGKIRRVIKNITTVDHISALLYSFMSGSSFNASTILSISAVSII